MAPAKSYERTCMEDEKMKLAESFEEMYQNESKEKDNLIEILKLANAGKDEIINQQAGELVFAYKQIRNREAIIKKVKELVSE